MKSLRINNLVRVVSFFMVICFSFSQIAIVCEGTQFLAGQSLFQQMMFTEDFIGTKEALKIEANFLYAIEEIGKFLLGDEESNFGPFPLSRLMQSIGGREDIDISHMDLGRISILENNIISIPYSMNSKKGKVNIALKGAVISKSVEGFELVKSEKYIIKVSDIKEEPKDNEGVVVLDQEEKLIMNMTDEDLKNITPSELNRKHIGRIIDMFDILWGNVIVPDSEEDKHSEYRELFHKFVISHSIDGIFGTHEMLPHLKRVEDPFRILKKNNISIPEAVEFLLVVCRNRNKQDVIDKIMMPSTKLEDKIEVQLSSNLNNWLTNLSDSDREWLKKLFACFVLADSMEMGSNWLRKVAVTVHLKEGEAVNLIKTLEDPADAFGFISKKVFKRETIEDVLTGDILVIEEDLSLNKDTKDYKALDAVSKESSSRVVCPWKIAGSGATGFVGGKLRQEMKKKRLEYTALVREGSSNAYKIKDKRGLENNDLLSPDYEVLEHVMSGNSTFYHLGGMSDHLDCQDAPARAFAINTISTAIMANIAEDNDTRFIFSSTFYVYGLMGIKNIEGKLIGEFDSYKILEEKENDPPEIKLIQKCLKEWEVAFKQYVDFFVETEGGKVSVGKISKKYPDIRIDKGNIESPEAFVERIIRKGVQGLSDVSNERWDELGIPRDYIYPLTKLLGERLIGKLDNTIIVRFANLFGDGQEEKYKVGTYLLGGHNERDPEKYTEKYFDGIAEVNRGEEFKVYRGGRDCLGVDDCVKDLFSMMSVSFKDDNAPRIINLSSGKNTSNKDIAKAIKETLGYDIEIEWDKKDDKKVAICDNKRIRALRHDRELDPIEVAIKEAVECYRPDLIRGISKKTRIVKVANRFLNWISKRKELKKAFTPYLLEEEKTAAEVQDNMKEIVKVLDKVDRAQMRDHHKIFDKEIREQANNIEAYGIDESVFNLALKAKRENQNLIIGLDISWIPGVKDKRLGNEKFNMLIRDIGKIGDKLRAQGLDNVIIEIGTGKQMLDNVIKMAKDTNTKISNMVIIAEEKLLSSADLQDSFSVLRGASDGGKAFLAGIRATEILSKYDQLGKDEYLGIELLRILSITLELSVKERDISNLPIVVEYDNENRMVIFLPRPELMDTSAIVEFYGRERKALLSA